MVAVPRWSLRDAVAATMSPDLRFEVGAAVGVPAVVLQPDASDDPAAWRDVLGRLRRLPVVTLAAAGDVADAVGDVDTLVGAVTARPLAATAAAQLLRLAPESALDALTLESLVYSTLQGGPEHAVWLDAQGTRVRKDVEPRVRIDADDDGIVVTLTRPRLHNLLDRQGRDELTTAFALAALDGDDRPVRWQADGPSFCAGGDPAEFGTVADPSTAHAIRMAASPAVPLSDIRNRVTARVHGASVGAGIELAAFAHRVVADPATHFRLPELSMGLIPGVGGTWSIPRRIGRQRTLAWLLLDLDVDAPTALEWGLIDGIEPSG